MDDSTIPHNGSIFAVFTRKGQQLSSHHFIADKALNLRHFKLAEEEWKVVEDLIYVFKDATVFFSIDNKASITKIIPTMD
ncbi:hypothetical protein H0H92_003198 [Tricholoma furcatifolium]|nr:hypothetical protein H0H92_003198 [Tricholoma furcatifolium]